jgi:hypothetical protein
MPINAPVPGAHGRGERLDHGAARRRRAPPRRELSRAAQRRNLPATVAILPSIRTASSTSAARASSSLLGRRDVAAQSSSIWEKMEHERERGGDGMAANGERSRKHIDPPQRGRRPSCRSQ